MKIGKNAGITGNSPGKRRKGQVSLKFPVIPALFLILIPSDPHQRNGSAGKIPAFPHPYIPHTPPHPRQCSAKSPQFPKQTAPQSLSRNSSRIPLHRRQRPNGGQRRGGAGIIPADPLRCSRSGEINPARRRQGTAGIFPANALHRSRSQGLKSFPSPHQAHASPHQPPSSA